MLVYVVAVKVCVVVSISCALGHVGIEDLLSDLYSSGGISSVVAQRANQFCFPLNYVTLKDDTIVHTSDAS